MVKNKYFIGSIVILSILVLINVPYKCPWLEISGLYCAGCGFTRMIHSILKFEFYQAFRYNPLFFVLLILAFIYIIYVAICILLKKKYFKFNLKWLIGFAMVLLIFMILRNLDFFDYLKPTIVN